MFTLHRLFTLLILVLVPFAVPACGGDAAEGGDVPEGDAPAAAEVVEIENPATIAGVINFEGTPPPPDAIDMSEEPVCAEKHDDQPTERNVVVSDGNLANVFVYVKEGLTQTFPAPNEPKPIDQDGCIYHPHVMGIQAGQPLLIQNSDPVLHNINANPEQNRGFNISQPQEGMETTRTFSTPEIMIPVECDVHGWMQAFIGVVDHPYYAVTDESGAFRIENLPPGDYVLEAWHERYGTQTMNVTVGPDESAEGNFTFSESMATNAVVPLGEPIDLHAHHASTRAAGGRE